MERIIDNIINKAKKNVKTIVLPEAEDERVLLAARKITDEKIANIVLVSDTKKVLNKANELNIDVSDIKIVNPEVSEHYDSFANAFYELRKEKGISIEQAKTIMKDPMYFGVMMVKKNLADGMVAGAIHSTADTLRPALQIIKTSPGRKLVSSFMLMEIPNSKYEKDYIFSDCGLVPNPSEEELAEIAMEASKSYNLLIGRKPKVAMLSYSTLGSAKSEEVKKVTNATNIVKEKMPELLIDGELQLDAALDKEVASLKAPNSQVAGSANILVFPDLESGNIGYKLVERFAGANAYGPITQGLAKPINDLSRGCKSEDIVGAVAITAVQATEI